MQIELLNRKKWMCVPELSVALADYIENFCNAKHCHSSIGYHTPDEFESNQQTTLTDLI